MQETSRGSTPLPFDRRMEGEAIYRRTTSGEDGSEGGNGLGRAALSGVEGDAAQISVSAETAGQLPVLPAERLQAGTPEPEVWVGRA
jgi:hypothetical protein